MSTYTSSLGLEEITPGDQAGLWGNTTNNNLALIDQAVTGVTPISFAGVSGTTYTLTDYNGAVDEARSAVLNITGIATGSNTVVIPNKQKTYLVRNNTGQNVVFQTAAPSASYTVGAGNSILVFCDGNNNVYSGIVSPSAGTLGVAAGGTGATTFTAGFIKSTGGTNALTSASAVNLATSDTTGTLPVSKGGTGQTTIASGALLRGNDGGPVAALVGSSAGQVATWNGSEWIASAPGTGVSSFSGGSTGLTPSGATTGAVTLAGTLAVANGGTGATTDSAARANLGIGSAATVNLNGSTTQFLRGDGSFATPGGGGTVTSITAGTGLTGGTITSAGTIALANTAVTPGSYSNATITVDSQGRITSASSGSGGGTVTSVSGTGSIGGITLSGTVTSSGSLTLGGSLTAASAGTSGIVTTGTQTFAGVKTFNNNVVAPAFNFNGFTSWAYNSGTQEVQLSIEGSNAGIISTAIAAFPNNLRSQGYNYFPVNSGYFNAATFLTSNAFGCSATGVPANAGLYLDVSIASWVMSLGTGSETYIFNNDFFAPGSNGVDSCGMASRRWSEIYAANPSINTSDVTQKTEIRDLNAAEKRVAQRIKGLIKTFKWKDAVAKKGSDGARIHVGVIAQEVKTAFEAEGLDAHRYGMFCYDEWEAEEESVNGDGVVMRKAMEAGAVYGVRYEELLAFVIASL